MTLGSQGTSSAGVNQQGSGVNQQGGTVVSLPQAGCWFNEVRFQVGESVPDLQFRAESSILRLGETELRTQITE